jgi:uncharacterized protein (TIGR00369 family)
MTPTRKFTSLFGEEPTHEEPGLVRWRYQVKRTHFNPAGSLHGGVLSSVLDTVMGHAVRTVRPPDHLHAAINLNVHFLLPTLKEGGHLSFEGRVVQKGKRVIFAEAVAHDEEGRPVARGSSSYAIIAKR